MKQRVTGYAAMAVALVLLIGGTASAGENRWVSDNGHRMHVGGHDAMFFSEGANQIQMEDLADGETRVIGVGEKQVTASRRGDEVTITRAAAGDSSALDMKCTIGRDNCTIITFDDDPAKVMVVVEKTRTCENGHGDCQDVDVDVIAMGHGQHGKKIMHKIHGEPGDGTHVIRIKKTVECDDEGNCEESEEVLGDADGELSTVIIEALGDVDMAGHHGQNVFVIKGDQVTLRCSEGDTTMHVDPKEADEVFLCPKHSTPLEKSKSHPRAIRSHRMKVKSDSN